MFYDMPDSVINKECESENPPNFKGKSFMSTVGFEQLKEVIGEIVR